MGNHKTSRHVKANARTLSYAIRQYFRPALREISSLTGQPEAVGAAVAAASPTVQRAASLPTPDDQLIPTQPECSTSSAVIAPVPSEKSLGKRKRIEDDHQQDNTAKTSSSVQTRFTQANIPPALKKYWHQRYRLFSRYDEGIQMDYDGWFSVTPENVAAQIAERCRCKTIVDAFCGVGGNAIQFAMTCEKVIAIDNSLERLNCARANAEIYGVEEYITFIHADYLEWAREQAELPEGSHDKEDIDVIFMSPPWGGISYQEDTPHTLEQDSDPDPDQTISLPNPGDTSMISKSAYASYPLSRLLPKNGRELFNLSRKLTKNIAYYLPRNMDIHEAAALGDKDETVEVEEEWMGSKLKALTFYYGDLAKQT